MVLFYFIFLFTSDVRTRFDDNVILSVHSYYLLFFFFFEFGLVVISAEFTRVIPNSQHLYVTFMQDFR